MSGLHQQGAHVAVSVLGDGAQALTGQAAGLLERHQAQVRSDVARVAEALGLVDDGHKHRGHQQTDARHGGELPDGGLARAERFDALVECAELPVGDEHDGQLYRVFCVLDSQAPEHGLDAPPLSAVTEALVT